jgi:phospholipid-binding lipoprotein MlaA
MVGRRRLIVRQSLVLAAALLAAGCATTPGDMRTAEVDPLEGFNRGMYKFNKGVDTVAVKPATQVYRAVVPKAAQNGLRNGFNNVDEPFSFINALLQGKIKQAFRTLDRFLINSTLGVGGLADHATDMGRPEEPEDFGQTLAVWGVRSGPFIVLPLLGPSTLRDAVGTGLEFAGADPFRQFKNELNLTRTQSLAATGIELLDTRSFVIDTADALLKGSADEYVTVRSAYLQLRQSAIYDGAPPEEEAAPPPVAPQP